MIGSTGRRAGATVAAIALAGAGALASAPLASAGPAASPQACLDSIKNVRFNDTKGQFLLGGVSAYKAGVWDMALPLGVHRAELAGVSSGRKGSVVWFYSSATSGLSASADHDSAACRDAVVTFGFSKADGTGYRNAFARSFVMRPFVVERKAGAPRTRSLTATLPISPKDTGEWKVRQVAVRQGGKLVVKPIGDVGTTVLRASTLNGVIHDRERTELVYRRNFTVIKPTGKGGVQVWVPSKETRARLNEKTMRGGEVLWTGRLDIVGITGHLTTISTKGGLVGLKGQTIVLQARKGGAKGTWQTVLAEQKSTHANGYYLLQVKRAKVAGQELRLHYPSPYQSIAKSYQYLGKVR